MIIFNHLVTQFMSTSVSELQTEVKLLRSLVISMIGEKESIGEYKASFVKEMIEAVGEKPTDTFTTYEDFTKLLKKN